MQSSWIPVARGHTVPQARVDVGDLHEEHVSRAGFFGPAAMLYHQRPPCNPARTTGSLTTAGAPWDQVLTTGAPAEDGIATPLLFNDDIVISASSHRDAMPFLLRNVDADTLYFVHEGAGVLATEFGPLQYEMGDFLYVPKGVTYRLLPSQPTSSLVLESRAPIEFTEHRQVGRHAPFDPGVLKLPDLVPYDWPAQPEWEVVLKHGDESTSQFYEELPFDVVGWKGDLFPFAINIDDIRPITSERMHLAPSAWSVFEGPDFMCVAFLPMQIVTDPRAEELPSRHRNVDSDEVILMRKVGGVEINHLEHLPQGLTHGPTSRGDYDRTRKPGMQRLLEAVSIDSYKRLHRTPHLLAAAAAEPRA